MIAGAKISTKRFAEANAARMAVATARRAQVAELRADGLTFTAIAQRMGFSMQRASISWIELKYKYDDALIEGIDDPAPVLGLSARAGAAVWAAICRDVGEPVLP